MSHPRLVVIGLDCVPPHLVFEEWRKDLPHLNRLMEQGIHAPLVSTIPPITVPAWTAMMTSQDPGMLGLYGFRNRADYSYDNLFFANARHVKAKTVWNYLSRNRLRSIVLGVPQTYPPKPLNGLMVGSFLTPNKMATYTYPESLAKELDLVADGDYIIDVREFRTENKNELRDAIHLMTQRRFKVFRHLLEQEDFDFAIMVEMGTDRIHHGFWRFHDRSHRLFEPGNPYEHVIHDYYVKVDEEIGRTISSLPSDSSVMVVSDHGARGMTGAVCINEWLRQQGLLTLRQEPVGPTKFNNDLVDWSQTKAWGEGGYYSRIFLNVKGREPQGIIDPEDYQSFRHDLADRIKAIPDEKGDPLGTRIFFPEETYKRCDGIPPDLIVYFGDLAWRSAGVVGGGSIHVFENDTGPDDANHAQDGILIWVPPAQRTCRKQGKYSIYDIAPTILDFFGIQKPDEMIGSSIFE